MESAPLFVIRGGGASSRSRANLCFSKHPISAFVAIEKAEIGVSFMNCSVLRGQKYTCIVVVFLRSFPEEEAKFPDFF